MRSRAARGPGQRPANGDEEVSVTSVWTIAALLPVLAAAAMPDPVAFKKLDAGLHSGIEEPRQVAVRTAAEWKTLCAAHAQGRPCASVDFSRNTVLGVFLGTRPTAGFAVEITRVEPDGDGLIVFYRERKPGPDDLTAQMLTAPFVLVSVERVSGPIRFQPSA
jgi:hypothetical protein